MNDFFAINKTTRQWHLPIVAGFCVGIPVFLGYYFGNLVAGKLASLAGLSILYIQSNKLIERMILLIICCFGILASYSLGLLFAYSPAIAPYFLALYAFFVQHVLYRFALTRPPGNFFFIMLASVAVCTPFDADHMAEKIGYVALGTIFTCGIGLFYSLFTLRKTDSSDSNSPVKSHYTNVIESITFGLFVGLSLAVAFMLHLENPYWVPVSCAAVMQGANSRHVSLRALQRITGTAAGLGITWFIFSLQPSTLVIVFGIMLLQVVIEFLVVRNYAIAVLFITILTVFLAESDPQNVQHINSLFIARLADVAMGSIIGIIGGVVLFNQQLHDRGSRQVRRATLWFKRKK